MKISFEQQLNNLSKKELIDLLMEEKLTLYFTQRNAEQAAKTLDKKEQIIADLRKMIQIQDEVITMKNEEIINILNPLYRMN